MTVTGQIVQEINGAVQQEDRLLAVVRVLDRHHFFGTRTRAEVAFREVRAIDAAAGTTPAMAQARHAISKAAADTLAYVGDGGPWDRRELLRVLAKWLLWGVLGPGDEVPVDGGLPEQFNERIEDSVNRMIDDAAGELHMLGVLRYEPDAREDDHDGAGEAEVRPVEAAGG